MRAIPFDTSVECSNTAFPVPRPSVPPDARSQVVNMTRDMDPSMNSLQEVESMDIMHLSEDLLNSSGRWLDSSFGDPEDLNVQLLPASHSPHVQNPAQGIEQDPAQTLPSWNEIYRNSHTTSPYDFNPSETHHVQAPHPQQPPQIQTFDSYYGSSPADVKPTREELLVFRQRTDSVTSSCSNYDPSSGFEPQPGTSHDNPRGRVRVRSEPSVGSENEDEVRKKRRRERNKVAAAKCREKKRHQQSQLIRDHASIRVENQQQQRIIEELRAEILHLREKLNNHACCMTCTPASYPDQNQQWSSWGGTPMG
ncbi:basic leucine zipper (bZIP) transcription factor atfB [Galendromus occidentalis]|uniref:Basic leucine zipper (BZIP) transcription factor atfB n=1 Tax=Galendromus occidentalis TaxID=34638 RepID=A0AAJ6QNZ4_9ACAR|nr:basic leucine zipper (bZIP) transcription factor atfB [Galendromus occidentalis]